MKKIIIIIIAVIFSLQSFAQWDSEYDFPVFRAGLNHSFFDAQPDSFAFKFLDSPFGDMQLLPASYVGYTGGFHGGLHFNHDMENNYSGIGIGIEYTYYGISAKYETVNKNYSMIETHYVTSLVFPVYFKLGKKMYRKQRYFFIGGQYYLNLNLSQVQEISWNQNKVATKLTDGQMMKSNYGILMGFNYMIFNFEAVYVLGGFMNKNYEKLNKYSEQPVVKPYNSFPKGVFLLKTNISIPINPWSSRSYYSIERWIRRQLK